MIFKGYCIHGVAFGARGATEDCGAKEVRPKEVPPKEVRPKEVQWKEVRRLSQRDKRGAVQKIKNSYLPIHIKQLRCVK